MNLFQGTPIPGADVSECVKKNTSSKDAIVASHLKQSSNVSCLVSGHLITKYNGTLPDSVWIRNLSHRLHLRLLRLFSRRQVVHKWTITNWVTKTLKTSIHCLLHINVIVNNTCTLTQNLSCNDETTKSCEILLFPACVDTIMFAEKHSQDYNETALRHNEVCSCMMLIHQAHDMHIFKILTQ